MAHSAAALKNEEDHCKLNQKGEGEVGKVWGEYLRQEGGEKRPKNENEIKIKPVLLGPILLPLKVMDAFFSLQLGQDGASALVFFCF